MAIDNDKSWSGCEDCWKIDNTALSLAAMNGDQVTLSALIKAGADVNRKNIYDWTALKAALVSSNIKCVKLLVQAGADGKNTMI